MKQTFLVTLLAAMTLALISCSTTYEAIDQTPGASYNKGVPGGTVVQTHKLSAAVTGIEASSRKLSLITHEGENVTVKCGPEVADFELIRVGDMIKATVVDELTISMSNASASTEATTGVVAIERKGAKTAAVAAETQQYTATVTAVNLKRHEATLRFPDGSTRKFAVRKDIDLTQRAVGEKVTFRVTIAMAVSIKKL